MSGREHDVYVFSYGQRWEWECSDCAAGGRFSDADFGQTLHDCWAAADAHRMASAADPLDAA